MARKRSVEAAIAESELDVSSLKAQAAPEMLAAVANQLHAKSVVVLGDAWSVERFLNAYDQWVGKVLIAKPDAEMHEVPLPAAYPAQNAGIICSTVRGSTSMNAMAFAKANGPVDMLILDGLSHQTALDTDLEVWLPLVRLGGVIACLRTDLSESNRLAWDLVLRAADEAGFWPEAAGLRLAIKR